MMSFLTMVSSRSCPGPGPGSEELDSCKAPLSYRHSRVWRANSLSGWSTHDVLQRRNIKQNLHNSAPGDVWSGLSPCFSFPGAKRRGQGSEVKHDEHREDHLTVEWVFIFLTLLLSILIIFDWVPGCCSSLRVKCCWSDLPAVFPPWPCSLSGEGVWGRVCLAG